MIQIISGESWQSNIIINIYFNALQNALILSVVHSQLKIKLDMLKLQLQNCLKIFIPMSTISAGEQTLGNQLLP